MGSRGGGRHHGHLCPVMAGGGDHGDSAGTGQPFKDGGQRTDGQPL